MLYVGCDIGGMSVKVGIINEEGKILSKFVYHARNDATQEEYVIELAKEIKEHINLNYKLSDFVGIGVGCPGAINIKTGICEYNNNLGFRNLNIAKIMKDIVGLDTRLSNDANVAALGESKFGSGKKYHNVVMLTLGTGVGGGVIINDVLFEGNEGKGAELGHMIINMQGEKCSCGLTGCLEAYASATALIRETKEEMLLNKNSRMWQFVDGDIDKVDGRTAFETMKEYHDESAIKVVNNYVRYLGTGILNYCNIFRPEAILLGGGVSNQKENLTRPLIKFLEEHNYGYKNAPIVNIETAVLGNDAGMVGAAALFMK